jgi:hypothetical protein
VLGACPPCASGRLPWPTRAPAPRSMWGAPEHLPSSIPSLFTHPHLPLRPCSRAHATVVVAAIAEPAKLHATASLSLPVLESSRHHLRLLLLHALRVSARPEPTGAVRPWEFPPLRRRRRQTRLGHLGLPWAGSSTSTGTRKPPWVFPPLGRHRHCSFSHECGRYRHCRPKQSSMAKRPWITSS